jgi:hypothetical protein
MKLICFFILFISVSVQALVPVEGIILGEAQEEYQSDPLRSVFRDIYDTSKSVENKKMKFYFSFYNDGIELENSCSYFKPAKYAWPWDEKQARRSMAGTLQYIGLDTTIKAIGAYAKKFKLEEDQFHILKKNLVKNYCSQNITVFSLKTIERSLEYYYKNPSQEIIPSILSSPYATNKLKETSEQEMARSKEFDFVIKSFKSFCSWGGEVEDYRLLTPYLSNSFIMSEVIKNMSGLKREINEKTLEVLSLKSDTTVQVVCEDLICRKRSEDVFKEKFPLSLGSTGRQEDLIKNYCHHFKLLVPPKETIEQVREWIKKTDPEDPILETSFFISLITGVPDFFNGVGSYQEVIPIVKSSIQEGWDHWATGILTGFSQDFLYEESMKIRRRERKSEKVKKFSLIFDITMGEMDRVFKDNDKLSVNFEIKLSKNYLLKLKSKWIQLQNEVDTQGQEEFKKKVSSDLGVILKDKEKLFSQKIWSDEFYHLVAEELIDQSVSYEGPLFQSYKEKMISIPIKFTYGLFALSFLKYRADVAKGRIKMGL